jgi:DNA replication terminus site-binding protein
MKERLTLKSLFDSLMDCHDALSNISLGHHCYMAEVGNVKVAKEHDMQMGELALPVEHYDGSTCQYNIKRAWRSYKVERGASTKYVKRFPGYVRLQPGHKALAIVKQINVLKDDIAACVQGRDIDNNGKVFHTRNHVQKHEFIHSTLPRVMTSQLYREIKILEGDFKSISFYWSRKHVPKRLNKVQAADFLKQKYDQPKDSTELSARVATIENSHYDAFAIPKIQHSVVMASLYNGHKNTKVHGTTPIIIVSDDKQMSHNHLADHEAPHKQTHRSMMFGQEVCWRTQLHEVIPIQIRGAQ